MQNEHINFDDKAVEHEKESERNDVIKEKSENWDGQQLSLKF